MYHGDVVTVLFDHIKISEKELAPIGILDGSTCWARWLPDRFSTRSQHSHLIISPFEVSSWPVLFRMTIILDDTIPGQLSKVLNVLKECNFNILAIEGTPAGHNHAIVNLIGEAIDLKNNIELLSFGFRLRNEERVFANEKLKKYIHEKFAPTMLEYSDLLYRKMLEANRTGKFLRENYLLFDQHYYSHPEKDANITGILFNPRDLKPSGNHHTKLDTICKRQTLKAVNCTWLQRHAFFWLYGEGTPDPQPLKYLSNDLSLRPDTSWKELFRKHIGDRDESFEVLSSINYTEQFLRILFSKHDDKDSTLQVALPYSAKLPESGSTSGLLSIFCSELTKNQVNLRRVVVTTRDRSQNFESGTVQFLVSDYGQEKKSPNHPSRRVEELTRKTKHAIHASKAAILSKKNKQPDGRMSVEFSKFTLAPLSPRTLFLSTNCDYNTPFGKNFKKEIERLARERGFEPLIFDVNRIFTEHPNIEYKDHSDIRANITNCIRDADAFLQVIFERSDEDGQTGKNLSWISFEYGLALAFNIPCSICVELNSKKRTDWHVEIGPMAGMHLVDFRRDIVYEKISEALSGILLRNQNNRKQVKKNQRHTSDIEKEKSRASKNFRN